MEESPWMAVTSDILGLTPKPPQTHSLLKRANNRTPKPESAIDPSLGTHPQFAAPPVRKEGQSLLKRPLKAETTPSSSSPASLNILSLDRLAENVGFGKGAAFAPISDVASDSDSDALQAAEDEDNLAPISKKHVGAFDKIKRRRRYINKRLFEDEFSSDGEDEVADVTEQDFIQMFRSHVKRKKLRRRIRANPDLEEEIIRESTARPASVKRDSFKKPKHGSSLLQPSSLKSGESLLKNNKVRDEKGPSIHQLTSKRRKMWTSLAKKEIPRSVKQRNGLQKDRVMISKKLAVQCMKAVRQKAMLGQKSLKEATSRAKKLTREMQAYWRHFDKIERQAKRQQEKELEEQQKIDVQLLEAKRQQRKLNFLITQTELYAHFMANKIERKPEDGAEDKILQNLDESKPTGRLAEIDSYDSDQVKQEAYNNASQAVDEHFRKTRQFDSQTELEVDVEGDEEPPKPQPSHQERPQPDIFQGTLKKYQLKGMNWLLDLYEQGINGILADEMGLGKTVQSLAMLAHIAEKYGLWGPFLIITPASTLHNWQQEIAKFIPSFKVVPYWGTPQERKVLRHFWDQTNLHKKSASFHVVVTSYQLMVTDFKYFNRIKWQYMVLDEAQAIKSSASQRWKMLLEFRCRNRLLLSGTPIQNSMAELWSLLHFVMPTLFDSHDEFNDWFSKDIESSAESKSQVDEKQISRLHLILKPFMLRRIKKDVENELTDKVEVLVYCPLTIRQKLLYSGLKRKIRIEDLLQNLRSGHGGSRNNSESSSLTSSLMNLVMQFRKVCNHPELFERREVKSPFVMDVGSYTVPKMMIYENIHSENVTNSKHHWLYNKLCIFNPQHVHRSLMDLKGICTYSYLPLTSYSVGEHFAVFRSILGKLLRMAKDSEDQHRKDVIWCEKIELDQISAVSTRKFRSSETLKDLVFTRRSSFYGFNDVKIHSMPETVEHRQMRYEKRKAEFKDVAYSPKPTQLLNCIACEFPDFLYTLIPPKVATTGRMMYSHNPKAVMDRQRHTQCSNITGKLLVTSGTYKVPNRFNYRKNIEGGLTAARPKHGWSNVVVPDKQSLVSDAGKLFVLDNLLSRLKEEGHRILIYSQMTKMIDLLEEFMVFRKHTYMRLDGSSKIHERRDMVADFQNRSDIFVFLLSTRAGGLGINLTAADTVIFYDSDWNPTVDQQAMDRAHRLGQTKQVTVYRLICKGTIEERILQRAREKSEIQRMVIQGGSFKGAQNELRPKEVVSLLLDDDEMEKRIQKSKFIEDLDETSTDCSAIPSSDGERSGTRPSSPILDFLGDEIGPKRSKRTPGKRKPGRPPNESPNVKKKKNPS